MHQLRLFEMLVGRVTAVVTECNFRFGKNHLQGKGWQCLVALGLILTSRTAVVIGALIISAKPAGVLLVQLVDRLLGT